MINFNTKATLVWTMKRCCRLDVCEVIESEKKEGEINYIFCDDEYLHKINLEYLNHDNLTDIISFDYTMGNEISGDIFISVERVQDNSNDFKVPLRPIEASYGTRRVTLL
jgi:ssRNA-specific RNase YbeY (16S rRNA maturation enzyme)